MLSQTITQTTYKYQKDAPPLSVSFADYWNVFVKDVPNRVCSLCGGVNNWQPGIIVHQFGSVRVAHSVMQERDRRSWRRIGSIVMWQGRVLIASSRQSEEEE